MPFSTLYSARVLLRRPALKFAALAALALLLVGGLLVAFVLDAPWLQRAWWLQHHATGTLWQAQSPWLFLLGYTALFTLLSALALPGCAPLALLAGTWFGCLGGTLVVGLASTLGALLSFLAARHWARDAVQQRLQRRFGDRLQAFEDQLRRRSLLWLFWLRLVPLVPYPVLNPLLGLSRLPVPAFFWPSLAGLTLGSLPWVCAGLGLHTVLRGGELPFLAIGAAAALLVSAGLARHGWTRRRTATAEGPAR